MRIVFACEAALEMGNVRAFRAFARAVHHSLPFLTIDLGMAGSHLLRSVGMLIFRSHVRVLRIGRARNEV